VKLAAPWLAVALALGLGACGDAPAAEVVPVAFDRALAPPAIGADLKLYENSDEDTLAAFANVGERSVMADGDVWEIRRADRLIGTLQIGSVVPDVDLQDLETRRSLVSQILASEPVSIRIADIEVYSVVTEDKATYVWFGAELFEVLQVRDRTLQDFEPIVTAVIEHQRTLSSWVPLAEELE
jgi:hypothetical protein